MNLFSCTLLTAALFCISPSSGIDDGTCSSKTKNCAAEAFSFPEIDLSLNELEQDDPKLIEVLRERYLVPPAGRDLPYNWSKPTVTLKGGKTVCLVVRGSFDQTTFLFQVNMVNHLRLTVSSKVKRVASL